MDYITRPLLDSAALKQQGATTQADVMRAVETARRCGLHILGLFGRDGGKLRQMVEVAHRCGLRTLGLLGKDGGALGQMVALALVVPSFNTQRVQEVHITVGHILCEELERRAHTGALRTVAQEEATPWKPY